MKGYLKRHPQSEMWVDFGDFAFYRMDIAEPYYVGGFGVMGWVTANDYRRRRGRSAGGSCAERH